MFEVSSTGDGTGDIHLRIGPSGLFNTGRFEGEIDNLVLSAAPSTVIPEPSTAAVWLVIGLVGTVCFGRRKRK